MLTPQDENRINQLIQAQLKKGSGQNRFRLVDIPRHTHDGIDSIQVSQADIIPNIRASGSITFATSTEYRLGITFNPTSVWFYGNAVHRTAGTIDIRAHVVGNAQLGPTYNFQAQTTTSVQIGGDVQNSIQSSTMFLIDSSTSPVTVRAITDELHLVEVEYPGTSIAARATVVNYSAEAVIIDVSLAAGWTIVGNYLVT